MTKNDEMMLKLNEIFDFIYTKQNELGFVPSIREIAERFNIKSTSSVAYYLKKLEELNYIRLHENKSRGIEIINRDAAYEDYLMDLPLLGTIPAGEPNLVFENVLDTYHIPRFMLPNANAKYFLLKVDGNSMVEVGINSNDIIVIKKQETAENGQIVAALVDGDSATVKRYFKDANGTIRLHPENKYMQDIYPTEIGILGIVVGLIRTKIY